MSVPKVNFKAPGKGSGNKPKAGPQVKNMHGQPAAMFKKKVNKC